MLDRRIFLQQVFDYRCGSTSGDETITRNHAQRRLSTIRNIAGANEPPHVSNHFLEWHSTQQQCCLCFSTYMYKYCSDNFVTDKFVQRQTTKAPNEG